MPSKREVRTGNSIRAIPLVSNAQRVPPTAGTKFAHASQAVVVGSVEHLEHAAIGIEEDDADVVGRGCEQASFEAAEIVDADRATEEPFGGEWHQ